MLRSSAVYSYGFNFYTVIVGLKVDSTLCFAVEFRDKMRSIAKVSYSILQKSCRKCIKTARLGVHLGTSSLETPSSYRGRMSKGNINKKKLHYNKFEMNCGTWDHGRQARFYKKAINASEKNKK